MHPALLHEALDITQDEQTLFPFDDSVTLQLFQKTTQMFRSDGDHLGQFLMLQREVEFDLLPIRRRLVDFQHNLIQEPLQTVYGRQTAEATEGLAVVEYLLAEHPEHLLRKFRLFFYETEKCP